MFTGIIERVGKLRAISVRGRFAGIEVELAENWDDLEIGESIAVNGICLTLAKFAPGRLFFDISESTLSDTAIREKKQGDLLNLERALKFDGRIGGHIVQGHVDGVGVISHIAKTEENIFVEFSADTAVMDFLMLKASVAVDGVSLTVQELMENKFSVAVIPHTWQNTAFPVLPVGSKVNIETDVLGKYVREAVKKCCSKEGLTFDKLSEYGF